MQIALVVPVKSFDIAKGRLADVLNRSQRADLAKRCAETVIAAGRPWPVYVVCDSDDVATWADGLGARVVRPEQSGLNAAVSAGRAAARRDGAEHIVIAHGDLPLATTFVHVVVNNTVSIVPDRHRDGTNIIALPASSPFETQFGVASFSQHCAQAHERNIDVVIIDDDSLALDLDTADDLQEFNSRLGVPNER